MATATQSMEKKRLSKAVKRKVKKAPQAPAEEEALEEKPSAQETRTEADAAAPEKTRGAKNTPRKTKANRLEEMQARAEEEPREPRGVIYVGHIPDGFAEPQMRKFFSQFGRVLRLRISRSKKTARSKGYAFLEFEEEGVAKIVADTMQGYLLFDKTLVCHLLPKAKQHPALFKGCRRRMVNTQKLRRTRHTKAYNDRPTVEVNGEKVPRHTERQVAKRTRSDKKLSSLLANLGVEYDIAGADEELQQDAKVSSPKASSPKAGAPAPDSTAASTKKRRKVAA